jgi:hypothetical protein
MLLRNDLLRYEDDDRTVRVLWLRADSAGAAIIEMSSEVALPSIVRVDALLQDVQEKRARLLNPDPYLVLAIEAAVPDSYKAIRDSAWAIIKDLVNKEPDIYCRISEANCSGLPWPSTRLHSRRSIAICVATGRGGRRNALLPDYANSGGRGKERKTLGKSADGRASMATCRVERDVGHPTGVSGSHRPVLRRSW